MPIWWLTRACDAALLRDEGWHFPSLNLDERLETGSNGPVSLSSKSRDTGSQPTIRELGRHRVPFAIAITADMPDTGGQLPAVPPRRSRTAGGTPYAGRARSTLGALSGHRAEGTDRKPADTQPAPRPPPRSRRTRRRVSCCQMSCRDFTPRKETAGRRTCAVTSERLRASCASLRVPFRGGKE